jgi:hypothetical protein
VDGPNGFSYVIGDNDIANVEGTQYPSSFVAIPGGVTSAYSGTYTFTIKTNNGLTATKTMELSVSTVAVPSETNLARQVNGSSGTNIYAGTTTPVLKWKASAGDAYYYRVRVNDWRNQATWYLSDYALGSTKDGTGYLSVTIPAGKLKDNTPYQWRVEVASPESGGIPWSAYSRADTDFYGFYTGTKAAPSFAFIFFERLQSWVEGATTVMGAGVVNLAPWDISTTDPNKFRVENENGDHFYDYLPNSDVLSIDTWPFMYYKSLPSPPVPVTTTGLGYKFFVSDGINSSSQYETYTSQADMPQLIRDQLTPHDNTYLANTQPTLTWISQGTTYDYKVMIIDWNNRRQVYMSPSDTRGLAQGQVMSLTIPAGILKESSTYRWFVETFDLGHNSKTRSEMLSITTNPAALLYADFAGYGIWKWDGTWSQVTPNVPTAMAVSGSLLYGNFGTGAGIWKWDGTTWSQVIPNVPTAMAVSGSLLYGNFGTGAGIWKWDGTTWSQVTPNAPTAMAASGSLLYGNYGTGAGIWKWDGTTWSQVTPYAPTTMAVSGSLLYGNFGTGAGIWKWDGSTWSQVTPNAPTAMVASGSLLYGNFGTGAGIWKWDGTTWSQVTPNSPAAMVASGSLLYGNFGTGAGIWVWDGTAWSQITPNVPTGMIVDAGN